MLNLLGNIKMYGLLFLLGLSISINVLQANQLKRVKFALTECQNEAIKEDIEDKQAYALYERQEKALRLMEKENAERAQWSKKRMDLILNADTPTDCDGAVAWAIHQIQTEDHLLQS
jgi:hypothetical protein